jgi:hypothetical protein
MVAQKFQQFRKRKLGMLPNLRSFFGVTDLPYQEDLEQM